MGKAVATAIEQMVIKIAIVQPLMQALQTSIGGSGGLASLLGLGGGVNANGSIAGAVGPTSVGGAPLVSLPGYADGTDSAPGGWSTVGERGPEKMYVPPRAQIIPHGPSPSASVVNVAVHNYGNDNVSVNSTQNANGGIDLKLLVGQAAAKSAATPGAALNRVMTDSLGSKQRLARPFSGSQLA